MLYHQAAHSIRFVCVPYSSRFDPIVCISSVLLLRCCDRCRGAGTWHGVRAQEAGLMQTIEEHTLLRTHHTHTHTRVLTNNIRPARILRGQKKITGRRIFHLLLLMLRLVTFIFTPVRRQTKHANTSYIARAHGAQICMRRLAEVEGANSPVVYATRKS